MTSFVVIVPLLPTDLISPVTPAPNPFWTIPVLFGGWLTVPVVPSLLAVAVNVSYQIAFTVLFLSVFKSATMEGSRIDPSSKKKIVD